MSGSSTRSGSQDGPGGYGPDGHADGEHFIKVMLDDEQLAAVEGWRAANLVASQSEAVRQLVRIGLLSEIAKIHQLVEQIREAVDGRAQLRHEQIRDAVEHRAQLHPERLREPGDGRAQLRHEQTRRSSS